MTGWTMLSIRFRTRSTDTGGWMAATVGRMRAVAAGFRRPIKLSRAERAARNHSHPEFYGRSAGPDYARSVKAPLNMRNVAAKDVKAAQAHLPIGPSCC
jgi:hypothetical protein